VTVKCLLIYPNPESALDEEAGKLLLENYDSYCSRARLITSVHATPAVRELLVSRWCIDVNGILSLPRRSGHQNMIRHQTPIPPRPRPRNRPRPRLALSHLSNLLPRQLSLSHLPPHQRALRQRLNLSRHLPLTLSPLLQVMTLLPPTGISRKTATHHPWEPPTPTLLERRLRILLLRL